MVQLSGKKIAMVLAQNFEDSEAIEPKKYLEDQGAQVTIIGMEKGEIPGKKGASLTADATFEDVNPSEFDAMVIPGGGSPEYLRIHDPALKFTKDFVESGKPVASICHGPQLLISAGVLPNRTLTSVNRIRDDITNAGGNYVDKEVVVDGNLITSRVPKDIPVFNETIGQVLASVPVGD